MESDELMHALLPVEGVTGVELHWSGSGLEVRVDLASMDWDARSMCIGKINEYVNTRSSGDVFPVDAVFSFPEPTDFTRYQACAGRLPGPTLVSR